MRRKLALFWTALLIAAALSSPAAVGAVQATSAAYRVTILDNHCTASFGVVFKVRLAAAGWTNANRLTIDGRGQTDPYNNNHWRTNQPWSRTSLVFDVNGVAHSLSVRRHEANDAKFPLPLRIQFRLRAWDHGLIAWERIIHSVAC